LIVDEYFPSLLLIFDSCLEIFLNQLHFRLKYAPVV